MSGVHSRGEGEGVGRVDKGGMMSGVHSGVVALCAMYEMLPHPLCCCPSLTDQLTRLHMILKPFMLRRIKQDVEHEMAPKVEVEVACPLSNLQRRLYQRLRNRITVEELLQSSMVHGGGGDTAKTSSLMNLVMQFRKVSGAPHAGGGQDCCSHLVPWLQVCNHPELFERLEVQSPLFFPPEPFQLPKLIYDSGESGEMCRVRGAIKRAVHCDQPPAVPLLSDRTAQQDQFTHVEVC